MQLPVEVCTRFSGRLVGWNVKVIRKGASEKGEAIYYIFMPANEDVIEEIINKDKKSVWLWEMLQQLQGLTLSDIQQSELHA